MMDILSGIAQVGAIVNAARDVVAGLRPQPKPAPASEAVTRQRFLVELGRAHARFIELRDLNGNGTLDAMELGVRGEVFALLDRNGDGEVSLPELNQASLTNPGLLNSRDMMVSV